MKCILAMAHLVLLLRSIVFSAPMCFWILWLYELLCVCVDRFISMLLSTWVSLLERAPKIMWHNFIGPVRILHHSAWCIYWCCYLSAATLVFDIFTYYFVYLEYFPIIFIYLESLFYRLSFDIIFA